MIKRLVDAVIHGFGSSAGGALFEHVAREASEAQPVDEPTPAQQREATRAEAKRAQQAARQARKLDEARRKEAAKQAKEVDAELAALKKRLRKT